MIRRWYVSPFPPETIRCRDASPGRSLEDVTDLRNLIYCKTLYKNATSGMENQIRTVPIGICVFVYVSPLLVWSHHCVPGILSDTLQYIKLCLLSHHWRREFFTFFDLLFWPPQNTGRPAPARSWATYSLFHVMFFLSRCYVMRSIGKLYDERLTIKN